MGRLNGITPVMARVDDHGSNSTAATVYQFALGERASQGTIMEGRGNSGMSAVVPAWPFSACDEKAFLCHQAQEVRMARLDDIWRKADGPICLAKLDVEGNELNVLRGALT